MAATYVAPAQFGLGALMLATDEDADDPNEIWTAVKCFLCDHAFLEGEEPWLIFEQRTHKDGHTECALNAILSSALGREVEEPTAHSTLLCDACNATVLEFEELEQRYSAMRYRILTAYNRTARSNDLLPIAIEINGVLQTDDTDLPALVKVEALPQMQQQEEQQEQHINIVPLDSLIEVEGGDLIALTEDATEETISQVELSVEAAAAALVDEVHDEEEEEQDVHKFALSAFEPVGVVDDPSKYEFAAWPPKQQQQKRTLLPLEFSTIKDEALSVPGLHQIDGQDIIIYDEIIEQSTTQASSYSDEGEGSQSMAYSNSEPTDNILYTVEGEISADDDNNRPPSPRFFRQEEIGSYFCLECDPDVPLDVPTFVEHMRSVHKRTFYTCELCSDGFMGRHELDEHMEQQHAVYGDAEQEEDEAEVEASGSGGKATASSYRCEMCQRIFTNHRLFRIHKRMHQSNAKQFECTECHKKYTSRNLLDEHMNMHTGARPFKCAHCPKDFASKYTLQTHLKIHSERERPFSCDECDKTFLNAQNLSAHKRLHVGVKPHVCNVCHKAFGTQHNLNVHKIMHTGARPFICRTCGKSFARRPEVKDHERIHSGERPFKCNLCPLAFAQRSNLQSHKKMTHLNEKLHTCELCDRTFKRRRLLQYHVNAVHTGKRPYKCELCTATFVYPEHQKKHMLIHTGEKPFACEVCNKQFNSRDNRNAHRFVHSDKKPYECLDCGMGFMRKPLLLAHMKHTKHSSDRIIVNQPQISFAGVDTEPTIANKTVMPADDDEIGRYMEAVAEGEEDDDDDEAKLIAQEAQEEQDAEINNSVNGQLIKDQIGDVKYLQFEDLDQDGQQTLTWVDIGGDKD